MTRRKTTTGLRRAFLEGAVALAVVAAAVSDATLGFAADAAPSPTTPGPRSVTRHERTVGEVADGVYVILHRDGPDSNPQGNTTVIIGDRDVMVVDSGYLPSSAREDLAQIKEWTTKPVRFLVNTHWHPDHVRGNPVYASAFPGLTILAHTVTPALEEGFDVPNRARYRARVSSLCERLKRGIGDDGKKLSDTEKKALAAELAGRQAALPEFESYTPAYPNVTFSESMAIDLGGRTVELRYLGKGHSAGDIVVYLPRERVLVTGDLVASPVPYFFAGYPYDQITTLEAIAAIDPLVIVPGHGEVMLDKNFLNRTIEVMKDVRDQVVREVRTRGSLSAKLEDVRKAVNTRSYTAEFAGTDKENVAFFQESMDGLVKTLFEQVPK